MASASLSAYILRTSSHFFFLTMRACHTKLPIRHCTFSFMRFTIKSKPRKNIPGEKMESEVIQMENLTFYNGVQMPVEGFGVFF